MNPLSFQLFVKWYHCQQNGFKHSKTLNLFTIKCIYLPLHISRISHNFEIEVVLILWNEAWWFLSLRVFGLFSSSLLLFPQSFGPICPPDLLQAFVELGSQHGTSNYVLYWIHGVTCSDSVSHNPVQVLSIPVLLLACSQDLTCNLQMIVSLEA